MHDTAYKHGGLFFELYWNDAFREVVDLGSQNVNGSLRDHCPETGRYTGLDLAPAYGVDVVVQPGQPLPLATDSVDVVVTSSCFEHDVCFWETFLELTRIVRPGGLIYINVPSNSYFHRYSVDCWRFYPDAGVALVEWSRRRGVAVELVESFVAYPGAEGWADFIGVFRLPNGGPLQRKGRLADHTRCMNISDMGLEMGAPLERESNHTPDTLAAAELKSEIDAAYRAAKAMSVERDALAEKLEIERSKLIGIQRECDQALQDRDLARAKVHELERSPLLRLVAGLHSLKGTAKRHSGSG